MKRRLDNDTMLKYKAFDAEAVRLHREIRANSNNKMLIISNITKLQQVYNDMAGIIKPSALERLALRTLIAYKNKLLKHTLPLKELSDVEKEKIRNMEKGLYEKEKKG